MTRLWDKGAPLDSRVLAFTAGEDHALDDRLVPYDVRASIAHAETLAEARLLSIEDLAKIRDGLLALGSARALRGVGWLRSHARTVQIFGGIMLVAVGVTLVTGAWDMFVSWVRDAFISEVTLPI